MHGDRTKGNNRPAAQKLHSLERCLSRSCPKRWRQQTHHRYPCSSARRGLPLSTRPSDLDETEWQSSGLRGGGAEGKRPKRCRSGLSCCPQELRGHLVCQSQPRQRSSWKFHLRETLSGSHIRVHHSRSEEHTSYIQSL